MTADHRSPAAYASTSKDDARAIDVDGVSADVLEELKRRVEDIDNSYRSVALKMGQLSMCADGHRVAALTSKPLLGS